MEKKNMVLLTVIAVATLLVAVVGATFAYFTATFDTKNPTNNTVEASTRSLTSVTFDYGNKIEVEEEIFPGWKAMKAMHVKGGGDVDADQVTVRLTLTPAAADIYSHLKYYVYEAEGTDESTDPNEYSCTESTPKQEQDGDTVKFYDAMTCSGSASAYNTFTGKAFTDGTSPVNIDIPVTSTTNKWYYVVIEYENAEGQQNTEQGKSFTVTMKASLLPQS